MGEPTDRLRARRGNVGVATPRCNSVPTDPRAGAGIHGRQPPSPYTSRLWSWDHTPGRHDRPEPIGSLVDLDASRALAMPRRSVVCFVSGTMLPFTARILTRSLHACPSSAPASSPQPRRLRPLDPGAGPFPSSPLAPPHRSPLAQALPTTLTHPVYI